MGRYVFHFYTKKHPLTSFILPVADADRKLLLAIISAQAVKVDSAAVATLLTTGEMTCTPRAVGERIKRLKKIAQEQGRVFIVPTTYSSRASNL